MEIRCSQFFGNTNRIADALSKTWKEEARGLWETVKKIVKLVVGAFLVLAMAALEGVVALPRYACEALSKSAPAKPKPDETSKAEKVQKKKAAPSGPDISPWTRELSGPLKTINPAEILGVSELESDPHTTVVVGIRKGLDHLRSIDPQYEGLIQGKNVEGLDPHLWAAGCALAWHMLQYQNIVVMNNCSSDAFPILPKFLMRFLISSGNAANNWRRLVDSGTVLWKGPAGKEFLLGEKRFDLLGHVIMKIRDPHTNWKLTPEAKRLVADIMQFAQKVVAHDTTFKTELYRPACHQISQGSTS